jgi:hypothetical protein
MMEPVDVLAHHLANALEMNTILHDQITALLARVNVCEVRLGVRKSKAARMSEHALERVVALRRELDSAIDELSAPMEAGVADA